jgi:hypothetical protein
MADKRRVDFPLTGEPDAGTCAKCGAAMYWIVTAKGRKLPLSVASKQTRDGVDYYESHFSDCPAADQFRTDRGNYG